MNATDFFNILNKAIIGAVALPGLLICQAAVAKSTAHRPPASAPALDIIINGLPGNSKTTALPTLNLSLPDDVGKPAPSGTWPPLSAPAAKADINQQILAGAKKQPPVKMDCGMDVLQTSNPDVSLTSRLSGECDLKYHY
jgi:hypothetical protein